MRDPYEVLEIKKGASKEEIRAAYKKLAKQYHPDQYDNNPLKDLAEEKMSEVNEAYDYLMKNTSDNTSKNYNQGSTYNNQQSNNRGYNQGQSQSQKQSYSQNNNQNYNQNNQYNPSAAYEAVRNCINYNNLNEAQRQLNSMPFRDAEWNYLMGLIFLRKGWYDDARRYITTACSMNPTSYEYRNALNQLQMQTNQYRTTYNNRNRNDVDMCDCCTQLWCADTLCECMGGDLISCC